MADNSIQGGTDTIRDKDRAGVKTQIFGLDLNPNGASEVLQAAAALADATANPTVPAWASMGMLFNGTTWDRVRGDTTNGLDVDVTRLPGSPAQEHTTAASPNGARLSDGAAFYNTNTGAQLPASLGQKTMANSLGVAIASDQPAVPVSLASVPTVTEKQDQTANVQTTWTSATALNTTTATYPVTGYGTANVGVTVPTTATAGAVTIEVSQDGGTTWVPAPAVRQDNGSWESPIPLAYFPGTNGSRIYAVSVDAFTHVRVKLTTVIVGAGNTVVTITAVAGGIEPFVTVRPRRLPTYRAEFRTTTRPYALGNAFGAAGRKQYATIFHGTASTKTVRLLDVLVQLQSFSATVIMVAELVRLTAATTPATGNPAITPGRTDTSTAAAEATTLALPTTAGTESDVLGSNYWGVTGPSSVSGTSILNPAAWVSLLNPLGLAFREDTELTMRAGVAEGFAVTIDVDRLANPAFQVLMIFTEEAP